MKTKYELIRALNALPVGQLTINKISILVNRLVSETSDTTSRELKNKYEKTISKMQSDLNLYANQIDGYKKMQREFNKLKKDNETASKLLDRHVVKEAEQKKKIAMLERKIIKIQEGE